MNRRGFLRSLISLPAIVPVAGVLSEELAELLAPRKTIILPPACGWASAPVLDTGIFPAEEITYIIRRAFVPKMVTEIYNTSPLLEALIARGDARQIQYA